MVIGGRREPAVSRRATHVGRQRWAASRLLGAGLWRRRGTSSFLGARLPSTPVVFHDARPRFSHHRCRQRCKTDDRIRCIWRWRRLAPAGWPQRNAAAKEASCAKACYAKAYRAPAMCRRAIRGGMPARPRHRAAGEVAFRRHSLRGGERHLEEAARLLTEGGGSSDC